MQILKIPTKIKRLRDNAVLPKYAHDTDSGADLYISNIKARKSRLEDFKSINKDTYTLKPFETVICEVGFSIEIEGGFDVQIRPTSGNSLKTPIRIANAPGTIDSNYRGGIGVIVQNVSLENWTISVGDKIAQMVIGSVLHANFIEDENLSETDRGSKGYGSTGIIGDKNHE